jgi:hypothetical protein
MGSTAQQQSSVLQLMTQTYQQLTPAAMGVALDILSTIVSRLPLAVPADAATARYRLVQRL